MVGGLGWTEILLIGAVVLIFMGGGDQLPKFARSLGEALNEFKKTTGDADDADIDPSADQKDGDPSAEK